MQTLVLVKQYKATTYLFPSYIEMAYLLGLTRGWQPPWIVNPRLVRPSKTWLYQISTAQNSVLDCKNITYQL